MKHDWEYKKIKDVCTKGSSNLQQNKIVELTGSYPVFGASGFVQNIDTYQQEKPYIGIVKDGSGVGRVNTYPAKSSLLGTMQYIIPNNNINLGYVAYCLQSLKLAKFASGAAIPHIYFRDYGETFIPVPPLSVQEQMCSLLDKINRVIEAKKEQLKELDNLAQAIFYDMFGDPVTNEKDWDISGFNDVFNTTTGKLNANAMVAGGQYPFFTCSKEIFYIDKFAFDEEALLLAGNNATANYDVKYYKGKFNAYQRTYVLTSKGSDLRYLKVALEEKLAILQEQSIGGMTKYLTLGILEKLRFLVPPLPLQQAFAEKVKAIERQKELINQSIKDVQTLFDAKMDYFFGD